MEQRKRVVEGLAGDHGAVVRQQDRRVLDRDVPNRQGEALVAGAVVRHQCQVADPHHIVRRQRRDYRDARLVVQARHGDGVRRVGVDDGAGIRADIINAGVEEGFLRLLMP